MPQVRLIKHEAVPRCGSYEVRIADQPSRYFCWDDEPSRRLRPEQVDSKLALEEARKIARAMRGRR